MANAIKVGYRCGLGGFFSRRGVVLLTTTGRHSGIARTTPVMSFSEGSDAWIVFAGAVVAEGRVPGWVRNLEANPMGVWVTASARRRRVRPRVLTGSEREHQVRSHHKIAEYQAAAGPALVPVIKLVLADVAAVDEAGIDAHVAGEAIISA